MKTKPPKGFTSREESLQHVILIASAFMERKPVQIFNTHSNRWDDCCGWCDLSASPHIFRIKPEPEEIYVTYHSNGARTVSDTPLPAASCLDDKLVVKKFREVIE